jgi:putative molybdopterin biosynthesis protein
LPDNAAEIEKAFDHALSADLVLLSGGTSKGGGDISYRALARRTPGILVHGVALKPGKPICLGVSGTTPVAILPGFPTSAIFTFHEFIAPLLRTLGGVHEGGRSLREAHMAHRVNSERGRMEYLLVNLISGDRGIVAYPMGKGSGSVTAFARADGFVAIPKDQEYLDAGEPVRVTTIGQGTAPADLVVIGSHCTGLDVVLGSVIESGYSTKTIWVGSQSGLIAAGRGECDVAGVHLLDPETKTYNTPFLPPGVRLIRGYSRMQGVVYRESDPRFRSGDPSEIQELVRRDAACMMVNRNRGSGTRVLIDQFLGDARPEGYAIETRSHNAVAASVGQGRADWGVTIEPVAKAYGLGFAPLLAECYDFAIPESRWARPSVAVFREALEREATRDRLRALGFLLEIAP